MMNIKSIQIRRKDFWDSKPKGPFVAQIEVAGPLGEVKLNIDEEMLKPIMAILADAITAAGRATAEAMTADVINGDHLLAAE